MKTFVIPDSPIVFADSETVKESLDGSKSFLAKFSSAKPTINENTERSIKNIVENFNRVYKYDWTYQLDSNKTKVYLELKDKDCGCIVDILNNESLNTELIPIALDRVMRTDAHIAKLIKKSIDPIQKKKLTLVSGDAYVSFIEQSYIADISAKLRITNMQLKREAKRAAKDLIPYKYKIGEWYSIRYRKLDHTELNNDVYEVKKVIRTIGATIVNVLIMKKVSDGISQQDAGRNILTHHDCRMFHIKYEPGLMVFNMNEKLYKVSKK